jgi:hypothetical protein
VSGETARLAPLQPARPGPTLDSVLDGIASLDHYERLALTA